MKTARLLDSLTIQAEGWVDRILALDRENMTGILEVAGVHFPAENRRKGLTGPSTMVVALLNGDSLDGYVEFCEDWNDANDIYFGSIQVRLACRHGYTLGILLVECAKALEHRTFSRLRAGVQKNNKNAVALSEKLGFEMRVRPGNDRSLDIVGERQLLHSAIVNELRDRLAGKYRPIL
jgi:hypothetical protein